MVNGASYCGVTRVYGDNGEPVHYPSLPVLIGCRMITFTMRNLRILRNLLTARRAHLVNLIRYIELEKISPALACSG